jgi:hypothetical protein
VGLLRLDHREPLGYGCVRAKKAAAFAGNSFSIRGRRIPASLSLTRARCVGLRGGSGPMLAPPGVDPVAQRPVVDPQITSDLGDRSPVSITRGRRPPGAIDVQGFHLQTSPGHTRSTHFTFLDGAYALYVRVWDADTGRRLGGAYDGCEI